MALKFKVRRCQPELVGPAIPTPHELKLLSDIDDQDGLRFHIPLTFIYRKEASMDGKDPVEVIRKALSQTLVFYYPLAGRLREGPGRKLMVECNGEGVIFIEADADITFHHFPHSLQPPFPSFHELLYDVPGSQEILDTPILLVQVTRLKCGGFILGVRLNHTMMDGAGVAQFMNAWTEMARGATKPSIQPVWCRELLLARDPPRITCNHREYDQLHETSTTHQMLHRSFFFGPTQIAALRRLLPNHLHQCTTFDLITACLWICRTKALPIEPHEDVRMMCIVNARARFNPPLPVGYYGNAFAYPAAVTTAGKLCGNPFGYAVELISKVKGEVTEEYMHSVADLMVTKGRCLFTTARSFIISDLRHFKLREIDFGWGKAVYGGVAKGGAGPFPGATYIIPHKNVKGEEGFVLPICLPANAMEMFEEDFHKMVGHQNDFGRYENGNTKPYI
ncbi:hypothetical protein RJT34_19023 [Clitoria ternatea]|uniref:Benzyl alcohol O-benzoyltransferase n=1 Tax=Clitoria ternatea TaxID=43366 RepID=A0AAN9IQG3_CLITE